MATIVKQLQQLVRDKADMKNNLETKGITGLSNADTFTTMIPKILDIQGGEEKIYTGHVDAEGLKIIGYDDETIAWYNENGVNWNEEQDSLFKLTDEDKSYYGLGEDDIFQSNSAINKKQYDISYMPNFEISLTRKSLKIRFSKLISFNKDSNLDTPLPLFGNTTNGLLKIIEKTVP